MKIAMELDDGTRYEAVANPKTFNGIASKSAFKKQFGVPIIVTSTWSQVLVPDEDAEPDADGDQPVKVDLSKLSHDQLAYLDEEHLAFLVWLELRRRRDDVPEGPWDELVERIAETVIDTTDEDGAADPTPTTASPTSSGSPSSV